MLRRARSQLTLTVKRGGPVGGAMELNAREWRSRSTGRFTRMKFELADGLDSLFLLVYWQLLKTYIGGFR